MTRTCTRLLLALTALLPLRAVADDADTPLTEADFSALSARPDDAAPLTTSELQSMGLGLSATTVDKSLRFSGFADFSFSALLVPKSSIWRALQIGPSHPTFAVGNINLYLSKYLTEKLFTLGEVRFTYLPNGSGTFGVAERTSTVAYDYNDFGRAMRWGGIEVERIYVDYIAHPHVTLRLGQYLTPFGIWNVDHGSPAIIPPNRPWLIAAGWFPERQTGIEIYGSYDVSSHGTLGYHLTLSNGTGPVSEYADLDDNKAIGARLYWDYRRFGRLRLGTSAYYGRDTNTRTGITGRADGTFRATEQVITQHDSLAFAADLLWTYRGWHVQTEWIVHQRAFTERGRTGAALFLSSDAVPADVVSWGGYGLVGYRFDWGGVMPFLLVERDKTDLMGLEANLIALQGGLNVRPVDVFVVKLSYNHIVLLDELWENQPSRLLTAQVAWAF